MYKLLRSFLFLFDPEQVHYFSMNFLKLACKIPFTKKALAWRFTPKGDNRFTFLGLQFPNRVGLGAGFDKNAKYLNELEALGFGFVEIGTVTPLPQAGNDKPRLFRLPKDKALINRMGFNNDGVDAVAERLKSWQQRHSSVVNRESAHSQLTTHDSRLTTHASRLIIGGNIGKNKITPNEDAWKDYEKCFLALHDYVDYFVVNVSSPNTPGLRELQEKDALHRILTNLQNLNTSQSPAGKDPDSIRTAFHPNGPKPILLKIAPDLTMQQIDDVISLAMEIKLDGLVVSNTTISREQLTTHYSRLTKIGAGGVSGLPLKHRSTEMVKYIYEKTKSRPDGPFGRGQIPIIASGGIFTGADAKEKIDAGASLVQVWTGFIYEGPGIVKQICKTL